MQRAEGGMSAATKVAKPLSVAARKRAIAQQTLWAVVDRCSGEIVIAFPTRAPARLSRRTKSPRYYIVDRINVRVLGVRS